MLITTKKEFLQLKRSDLVHLACDYCNAQYTKSKQEYISSKLISLGSNYKTWTWPINIKNYCSKRCFYKTKQVGLLMNCVECKNEIYVRPCLLKKASNYFCSQSCAATYNNQNKAYGIRRSKLEIWLEKQLSANFPKLEIHFNRKDAINSELDFYFPSLKLAVELNGIFHYEPIYGKDKLLHIQNNDNRKFQACIEHDIELCIIDTSSQKYFKPETSQKYLDIITNLVNMKLSKLDCVEVL